METKVYFHAMHQFLDLSGRMGKKIYMGDRVESQLTVQEILQKEYKNVPNGITLSGKRKMCSHEIYDRCMYAKIANLMRKHTEDNCTVPWILDDKNICRVQYSNIVLAL